MHTTDKPESTQDKTFSAAQRGRNSV